MRETEEARIASGLRSSHLGGSTLNSGPGHQTNHTQIGGSNNTQCNAHTQTFNFAADSSVPQQWVRQESRTACQNALLGSNTRPAEDREAIISAKGKRVEGTCEWIKDDDEYKALLRGENQLLWIRGGPGKGKTMLSIFLTGELGKSEQVIYYFCRAEDDTRRTAAYVLRSLLWQLTTKQPRLADHLLQYFDTTEKIAVSTTSKETLWTMFASVIQDPELGTTYCVIDGLDECDTDSQCWLATKLVTLLVASNIEDRPKSLRVILVSRDTIPILGQTQQIKLDPDNDEQVSADIRLFVSGKMQELSTILGHHTDGDSSALRIRTAALMLERAEGTFLWAGFAMLELLKQKTWTDVEAILQLLPKGLPALYDRMLLQIEPRHRQRSSRFLRWVTMAVRPLSLADIGTALGMHPSAYTDSDQSIRDQVIVCGPFVKITDGTLGLVHESAREYLLRIDTTTMPDLEQFRIQPTAAHLEIAQTCIASIARCFERGYLDSYCKMSLSEGLADYAIRCWPEHARRASSCAAKLVQREMSFFAHGSIVRHQWFARYKRDENLYLRGYGLLASEPPDLHMACLLGIVPWAQKLLGIASKTPISPLWTLLRVNQKSKTGHRPLSGAVVGGHIDMVRFILRARARVDAVNRSGYAALHTAANCDYAVARLLLDFGANVDLKTHEGHTALHLATRDDNHEVARLLLDRGADVNSRTNVRKQTPVHIAAFKGRPILMQLLLAHGADIDLQNKQGETALIISAKKGEGSNVRLLLERGADPNIEDQVGKAAMHWVHLIRSTTMVRSLCDHGADSSVR